MTNFYAIVTYVRNEYRDGSTEVYTTLFGAVANTEEDALVLIRDGIEGKSVDYSHNFKVYDVDFIDMNSVEIFTQGTRI